MEYEITRGKTMYGPNNKIQDAHWNVKFWDRKYRQAVADGNARTAHIAKEMRDQAQAVIDGVKK